MARCVRRCVCAKQRCMATVYWCVSLLEAGIVLAQILLSSLFADAAAPEPAFSYSTGCPLNAAQFPFPSSPVGSFATALETGVVHASYNGGIVQDRSQSSLILWDTTTNPPTGAIPSFFNAIVQQVLGMKLGCGGCVVKPRVHFLFGLCTDRDRVQPALSDGAVALLRCCRHHWLL